jgi:ribosomal protein S12 methylthiotransferase accessory factor
LGISAVDPCAFIRFSEEQYKTAGFPHEKPDPSKPIGWVKGFNVLTGAECFVPASMVYMYYVPLTEHDGKIDNGYSTGLAAGPNSIAAIHSGLREVIERDAYALHWLTARTAPKIDIAEVYKTADRHLRDLIDYRHLEIDARDYTTDLGVPCVLIHIRGPRFKGVASGSACNMNTYRCFEKAMLESFHTLSWCIDMQKSGKPEITLDMIQQYEHHVRYYFNQKAENKHNLDFLFANAPTSNVDFSRNPKVDVKNDLDQMLDLLDQKNYSVYAVDVTTEEVKDAGFSVMRTLVPGLQPLYCGIGNEHLDRRRINQFAQAMNLEQPLVLNTKPHPFP